MQTVSLPFPIFNPNIYKIVLSAPVKNAEYTRCEIISNGEAFQASRFTAKQVFHKNLQPNEVQQFAEGLLGTIFSQYTAWDNEREYSAKITKRGKLLTSSKVASSPPQVSNFKSGTFDRQKNHIIKEGEHIPALVDMGVFTKDYKVATGMQGKFQQINRFIELVTDETKNVSHDTTLNIVDFGCGKSYLTFLLYHYFAVIEKRQVNICGLDLEEKLIQSCTASAAKYGYDTLHFKLGDIAGQIEPPLDTWGKNGTFNIVISLHACDTATDHALHKAVKWNADLICAAPCCQHELRCQMKAKTLDIFQNYGIIEERIAALATDAIRAKLLEYVGYRAQIIEFTDMDHTAKNLMIRARRGKPNLLALAAVRKVVREFSFQPTLMKLLEIPHTQLT